MKLLENINDFEGEWRFNYKLPIISRFHLGYYISNEDIEEEYQEEVSILRNGMVEFFVHDAIDFNPDPSIEQINTFNFLQSNELIILKKIHSHLIDKVLPKCHFLDANRTPFQSDFDIENLRTHLAISGVNVYRNFRDKHAYYDLRFYFKGYNDEEWINFLFHRDRIIGFGYENFKLLIEKDSGSKYSALDMSNKMEMESLSSLLPSNSKYFKALPKHNKLKPWQAWYNEFVLEKLIDNSNIEEFKNAINSGQIDPNFHCPYRGHSLINRACIKNKPTFVEFLLKKKANTKHTLLYSNSRELVELIIK
jgi:hypothetical protein